MHGDTEYMVAYLGLSNGKVFFFFFFFSFLILYHAQDIDSEYLSMDRSALVAECLGTEAFLALVYLGGTQGGVWQKCRGFNRT